jgi:hypothetical protein
MGKRSNFIRKERDFYPTPYEAVIPLLPYLDRDAFCDPCAGNGLLIDHLEKNKLICKEAWDIEPRRSDIIKKDALISTSSTNIDYFITNPPWTREILHPLIMNLSDQRPTWLLFDADWMHTKQSKEYMKRCIKIISIGRLKWIPDSKMTGKDNCCWYLFSKLKLYTDLSVKFHGR